MAKDDEIQFRPWSKWREKVCVYIYVSYPWKRQFRGRLCDGETVRREKMKRDRDPWPRSGATQLAGGTERRMRSDREKDYPFDRETKTHAAATHACVHIYIYAHAYTCTGEGCDF